MTQLAALIFDVDGTLAETECDVHRVAFNDTFASYGLDWYWSESLYGELLTVTGGKERIKFYVENYQPAMLQRNNLDKFIAELHRDKTQRYINILRGGTVALRPGVYRLLKEAHSMGLQLAIATTTNIDNVAALLQYSPHSEVVNWFTVVAAGDVVTAKKPAPDIYHYALAKLGLPSAQCLAIEDSDNGLNSALSAGLRTIITTNDYTQDQDFTGAALVVNHLGEPDQPCIVQAGKVGQVRWVDVDLLHTILNLNST